MLILVCLPVVLQFVTMVFLGSRQYLRSGSGHLSAFGLLTHAICLHLAAELAYWVFGVVCRSHMHSPWSMNGWLSAIIM